MDAIHPTLTAYILFTFPHNHFPLKTRFFHHSQDTPVSASAMTSLLQLISYQNSCWQKYTNKIVFCFTMYEFLILSLFSLSHLTMYLIVSLLPDGISDHVFWLIFFNEEVHCLHANRDIPAPWLSLEPLSSTSLCRQGLCTGKILPVTIFEILFFEIFHYFFLFYLGNSLGTNSNIPAPRHDMEPLPPHIQS